METASEKMKAVLWTNGKVHYSADTRDKQKPGKGQVLIKVEAAVINPSDCQFMRGDFGGDGTTTVPGSEGSGTVVEHVGALMGMSLVGKRVGFTKPGENKGEVSLSKDGAYAEYIVTNSFQCFALGDKVTWEQGAGSFVNPLTCVGLLDKAKEYKAPAVISTGAASQLGRMIIKLFRENGIQTINVVRRQEQVDLLKNECGAQHVLNSTDKTFDADLEAISKKLGCNVVLECVGGDMIGKATNVLPKGGIIICYGNLSDQKLGDISPVGFIYKHIRLEGFMMLNWLMKQSLFKQMKSIKQSRPLITETKMSKCFGLHQIDEAIDYYMANMTAGKVYLKPSLTKR